MLFIILCSIHTFRPNGGMLRRFFLVVGSIAVVTVAGTKYAGRQGTWLGDRMNGQWMQDYQVEVIILVIVALVLIPYFIRRKR